METPQFTLRPSAAGLWVRCAGYATLAARFPELPGDNEVREEGAAGHWAAYEIGNGRPVPEGTIAPNGVELTEEILDGVAEYLMVLRSWGVPVYMESQVAIPSIHKECGGTVDAWSWDPIKRIMRVADLKLGYRPVDPFELWQLLAYVRGVLDYLQSIYGQFTEHFTVEMIIVQPRGYGHDTVKTWRVNSQKLIPYMHRLRVAAEHAVAYRDGKFDMVVGSENGAFTAGPHCENCSAKANCATLQNASLQLLDVSGDHGALELTYDQAAAELRRLDRAIKVMEARQAGLEGKLEYGIKTDNFVLRNFEVGSGSGRLVWQEGKAAQAIALGKVLGHDIAKPQQALTPTQAKAKISGTVLDAFTERKPGKLKLRRLADNHADKLFNQE
jgi:hypothetical protein